MVWLLKVVIDKNFLRTWRSRISTTHYAMVSSNIFLIFQKQTKSESVQFLTHKCMSLICLHFFTWLCEITLDMSIFVIYLLKLYKHDLFSSAGCILAGGSKTNKRRADKAYNDDPFINVLVPVPSQSLSLYKLNEKDAKGYWIHFWHHLVGIWT